MAKFNEYPIDQTPALDDTVLTYDKSENANKQVELSTLKDLAVADVKTAISDLQDKDTALETALEGKANIEDVKATYATIESLDDTNANIETLQLDSDTFKKDIADLQTNDEEIEESIKTANENISALQSDNETNKTDISSLRTKDSELETALSEKATAKDLDTANTEITSLKAKDSEIENTLSAKANSEDVANTYATIANLESATNDIANLKTKDTELENSIKTATDDISELKSKDTSIESEIADLKAKDSDLESAISSIPKFAISVVDALPTSDISDTTVYLVKTSETETGNLYTEYIHVKDTWEQLGTQTLDLSNYYQKNEVDTLVSDNVETLKSKDTELANSIATKLSTDDAKATYATITSLENTDKNIVALQNKDTEIESTLATKMATTDADAKYATIDNLKTATDDISTLKSDNTTNKSDIASLKEKDTEHDTAISDLKTADARLEGLIDNATNIETFLSNYFAVRRTGKVYTTKIYKYSTSTSSTGVKMNANENMVCKPSTNTTAGQDDYQDVGLFQHFTCNWSVDDDGFNHVDALEGQSGFTKYGKVQVGEVTMSGWFGVEDTETAILYHYSDKESERTPHPMKASINPDGTLSPFMIHSKYIAGDIDGKPYSSKGLSPASGLDGNPVSYSGCIDYMHQLGKHYCATTCWDLFYKQLMMIIKYGTINSQSIMSGCSYYYEQYANLIAETGVKRVIIATTNASKFVVGSYVSIGTGGTRSSKTSTHNIAYDVKITSIETVDDNNSAIYVDVDDTFDTTTSTYITSWMWRSGSTDDVLGSDGSPYSNSDGKNICKIQGLEFACGTYEVLGNTVIDVTSENISVYVCDDASQLTKDTDTIMATYNKCVSGLPDTSGIWKYITTEITDIDNSIMIPTEVGATYSTGFADGLWTNKSSTGFREYLAIGNLGLGSNDGLWYLITNYGLSLAGWYIATCVSPNGTRGEYQASA